jgi:iron complex transport system substrate-binding protein
MLKKILPPALLALMAFGCGHDAPRSANSPVNPTQSLAHIPHNPSRVISFDYGSYDSLIALGLADRVLAIPGKTPPYLVGTAPPVLSVGGMKTPDLAALSALKPELILISARQAQNREALQAIAPTLDMSLTGPDYQADLKRNIRWLGELFEKSAEAERALAGVLEKAEQARQTITASGRSTLVLIHNDGRFVPTEQPLIYSLLKAKRALPEPPAQQAGVPHRRPSPLSATDINAIDAQVIFVIDRSAAIGQTPLDLNQLDNAPWNATPAGQGKRIRYLDPHLWYLSGGGLQSLELQIEEALAPYR